MATFPDQKQKKPTGRVTLYLLGGFFVACFIGALFIGDIAKFQDAGLMKEGQAALRGVADREQLEQVLKQYPSNRILKLIALARQDADDSDEAARKLLGEIEPAGLLKPAELNTASRDSLEALRRDLKTAEANLSPIKARYVSLLKGKRGEIERDARALSVDGNTVSAFMALIDAQHADAVARTAALLSAKSDYYAAYEKCAALLAKEFGTYKVTNGQIIFQLQRTADSYNSAAVAMAAAAKRMADLEPDRTTSTPAQLERWKNFVER